MNTPAKQIELVPAPIGAHPSPSVPTTLDMLNHAVGQNASVEVLTKLMDLHERHERNMARRAFDAALSDAKAEMPVISKNKAVDFTTQKGRTNYRYEDMGEIARTVDPILASHGLSYRFRTNTDAAVISVTCIVSHRGGWSEENTLSAGRDQSGNKNDIQAIGSTVTYLQRYSLKAALGLAAAVDDDGHAAGGNGNGGVITDKQRETIETLIAETGADVQRFCGYMKVGALAEIPARDFDRAMAALNSKRARS